MLPWKIKVTTWPLNNLTTSGRSEIHFLFIFHNSKSFPVSNFYESSVLPDVVKLFSCQVVTFIFHGSTRANACYAPDGIGNFCNAWNGGRVWETVMRYTLKAETIGSTNGIQRALFSYLRELDRFSVKTKSKTFIFDRTWAMPILSKKNFISNVSLADMFALALHCS